MPAPIALRPRLRCQPRSGPRPGSDASPDRHSSRGSGVDSERGSGRGSDAESERGLGRGSGADSERGSGRGSGAGSERGLGRDTLLCEEIVPLACTGAAEAPRWLAPEESERLLTARPERNLLPTALEQQLDLTLPALEKLRAALEPVAQERAGAQREAHERVRAATRAKGRVAVEPVLPVDLLGIYVLVPLPPSVREPT